MIDSRPIDVQTTLGHRVVCRTLEPGNIIIIIITTYVGFLKHPITDLSNICMSFLANITICTIQIPINPVI